MLGFFAHYLAKMFEQENKLPHAACRSVNWHLLALASLPRGSLFIFSRFPALPLKLVLMESLFSELFFFFFEGGGVLCFFLKKEIPSFCALSHFSCLAQHQFRGEASN